MEVNMDTQEQVIDQLVDSLCSDKVQYVNQASSFKSAKELEDDDRASMKKYLQSGQLQSQFDHAFEVIENYGPDALSSQELESLNSDLDLLAKYTPATEVPEVKSEESLSPQVLAGMSDASLTILYKLGYYLYEKKLFTAALDVFTLLFFLNPNIADSANAVARSYQAKNLFKDAIDFYTLALIRDPQQVLAMLSQAECYIKIGNIAEAKSCLEEIVRFGEEHSALLNPWRSKLSSLQMKCISP
jgi:tetratricopeptide (TPR) repeat protein